MSISVADAKRTSLERKLREQLLHDCSVSVSIGYRPVAFQRMLADHGPVEACRQVIMSTKIPDGFLRLWELKRVDLTAEATILAGPWKELFGQEILDRARRRLKEYQRPDLAN